MTIISRKRRRRLCLAVLTVTSLTFSASAVPQDGDDNNWNQEQQQPFETVAVSRYAGAASTVGSNAQDASGRINGVSSSIPGNDTSLPSASSSSATGRYGHAAVYQQYKSRILFIGGQIGTSGTFVTNDVLALDLTQPYTRLRDDNAAISASSQETSSYTGATNPSLKTQLSIGLPPNAWTASTVDAQERVWLIGGVTQDCESDAVAYVLDEASSWKAVDLGNYRPPRRRQAKAVAVKEGTEDTSIYIFGGIAEPYTCSLDTVGYLAMDIWNTTSTSTMPQVDINPWRTPKLVLDLERNNANATSDGDQDATSASVYEPAISDYAAVSMPQVSSVIYLGGQAANGKLLPMNEALIFDTSRSTWARQSISGDPPPPVMGHIALALDASRIVVHGGIGENGVPIPDVRLLKILDDGSLAWTSPTVADSSVAAPARAWHSATLADHGLVVIAFGLDGASSLNDAGDIFFLQTTDNDSEWRWYAENPLASIGDTASTAPTALAQAAPGANLGVYTDASVIDPNAVHIAAAAAPTSLVLTRPDLDDDHDDSQYTTPFDSDVYSSSPPSAIFNKPSYSKTSSSPASTASGAKSTEGTTSSKSNVIAGTVTAAFIAALAAGGIALYVRWKAANKSNNEGTPTVGNDSDGSDHSAPPVSQLLYTRVPPKRMLSLGSAFSVRTARSIATMHSGGERFDPVDVQEARAALDQLAGRGQIPVASGSSAAAMAATSRAAQGYTSQRRPSAQVMEHASSSDSTETRASVASYPYLTSVPRAEGFSSQHSHEGHELGLNLLRSRSRDTDSSEYTVTPQLIPQRTSSLQRNGGDLGDYNQDPFHDAHRILPDEPMHSRQRNISMLPPSLRPGA